MQDVTQITDLVCELSYNQRTRLGIHNLPMLGIGQGKQHSNTLGFVVTLQPPAPYPFHASVFIQIPRTVRYPGDLIFSSLAPLFPLRICVFRFPFRLLITHESVLPPMVLLSTFSCTTNPLIYLQVNIFGAQFFIDFA